MTRGVFKYFDVSMKHVCLDTYRRLDKADPTLETVLSYDKATYGFWIYSGTDDLTDVPADLQRLMRRAQELKCDWMLLDRDGTEHPDLHQFEWEEDDA